MATPHIVKHEIEHRINLALFRHRGDVYAAARETGVNVEFVKKLYKKLKKRRERDVSYWLASSIMQTIVQGYEQRTHCIQKYLNILNGKEEIKVSSCHHKLMKTIVKKGVSELVCSKCNQPADVVSLPRNETFELFDKLLTQLRKEDESLVQFADTMGFTDKETQPAIKQNILVVGNEQLNVDSNISEEVNKLSPRDREKTRKKLEGLLLDSIIEQNE